MSVSAGLQGPREKSRTLKPKAGSDAPAAPLSTPQTSTATTAVAATATAAVPDASVDSTIDDSARSCAPKYCITNMNFSLFFCFVFLGGVHVSFSFCSSGVKGSCKKF